MIVVIVGRPSSHRHYDFAARRFTPAFRRPPTAAYRRLSLLKLPAHIIRFRRFRTALFTLRRPAKGLFSKNRLSSEHVKSLSCSPSPTTSPGFSNIYLYARISALDLIFFLVHVSPPPSKTASCSPRGGHQNSGEKP